MRITQQTNSKDVKEQMKKTLGPLINTQKATENERDKRVRELFDLMRNISSNNYDKYTLDRFANIIMMTKYITGLPEEEIVKNIKETIIYQEIVNKNECFLYESYPANLEEMVEEWKEKNIPILGQITSEQISAASMWIAGKLD